VTAPALPLDQNPFEDAYQKWAADSALFALECYGFEVDEWQRGVCADYDLRERRISIVSGHGVGKTTLLAILIVHHILFRYPQKTVCTAPTSGQLFGALAMEVKAWIGRLPPAWADLLDVQAEKISLKSAPNDSVIEFRTSRAETPEALAGVHSTFTLLVGDEGSGIPEKVYEAGSGSMSGHNAMTILAGNPVRSSGLFFDTHNKVGVMENWCRHQVSCVGNPRVSADFVTDMAARYGSESNAFRVRVLGLFPKLDDDKIIGRALAEAALDRDVAATAHVPIWGVDVARFGSDKSALAKRRGNCLMESVRAWAGYDTMQTVGLIKSEWDQTPPSLRPSDINIDGIGIGAGVADRLRELGLPARSINVSEVASMEAQYRNLRTELWYKGEAWFQTRLVTLHGKDKNGEVWKDQALVDELTDVKYEFLPNGKRAAESKDKLKKRGVASPNKADAFLLTFASEAITAGGYGSDQNPSWNQPLTRGIKGIV
jgi:phage terminase large subunit